MSHSEKEAENYEGLISKMHILYPNLERYEIDILIKETFKCLFLYTKANGIFVLDALEIFMNKTGRVVMQKTKAFRNEITQRNVNYTFPKEWFTFTNDKLLEKSKNTRLRNANEIFKYYKEAQKEKKEEG